VTVAYSHPRGTKAALDTLASASGLIVGQAYLLTDEQRLVVAHAVNAYTPLAKLSEISGGALGIPDGAVTYDKLPNMAQGLIGRYDVGSGTVQFVGIGAGLYFDGVNLAARTGSVTSATVEETRGLTGRGVLGPTLVGLAAAHVNYPSAAGFTPDWDAFITANVTGNTASTTFEIGNPFGAIPGTSRVVYLHLPAVKGGRAVAWGSLYINPPAITVGSSGEDSQFWRIVLEPTPYEDPVLEEPYIFVSATRIGG